ncbi:MAG: peptidyl-prolyl cis-trans isomerase [Patescibacteria group bacterium]|jgi:cyclophilin family peptidyl-prolyl cis-trans isomerase|nr:peptidyl-prolyl cis-trans isomerase [Patescibacteria group bacterium]
MKYVILSCIIIAVIIWGGYYLFSDRTQEIPAGSLTSDAYGQGVATTTPPIGTQPVSSTTQPTQKYMITLDTNYGAITFETYTQDAPNTVANFVTLAGKKFYDGLTFHRVIKGFMIQGGDPKGDGTGGPGYSFADEIDPNSALYKTGYVKGVVAMANAGPNTNGSQFFIMTATNPLPPSYTIFGKVVSGQDVVDKIAGVKTGAGDKPVSPVTIKKVTVK